MGRCYDAINTNVREFIARQPVFFVATAPLSAKGHVNCSPKGRDTIRVLDANTLLYLDLPGSGVETIAHLRENGRIVIMFCAFEGAPKIYRFHGVGTVLTPLHAEFDALVTQFAPHPAIRALVRVRVERVSDSCGYGVPLMDLRGPRHETENYVAKTSDRALRSYLAKENAQSIDGLPGLGAAAANAARIDRSSLKNGA